jgi:protein-disulfide isomerase
VLDKYPKDVKLVMKNFPLDMHKFARKAAIAALAAHAQGKFWEFSHEIFESKSGLNDERMQKIAIELKLDIEKFNKSLNDPAIGKLIDRDLSDGQRAGVRGTPTVFVNGKLLQNRSLEGFQQAIEAELKMKK